MLGGHEAGDYSFKFFCAVAFSFYGRVEFVLASAAGSGRDRACNLGAGAGAALLGSPIRSIP